MSFGSFGVGWPTLKEMRMPEMLWQSGEGGIESLRDKTVSGWIYHLKIMSLPVIHVPCTESEDTPFTYTKCNKHPLYCFRYTYIYNAIQYSLYWEEEYRIFEIIVGSWLPRCHNGTVLFMTMGIMVFWNSKGKIGQRHGELNYYNSSWRASSMEGATDGLGWTTVPMRSGPEK